MGHPRLFLKEALENGTWGPDMKGEQVMLPIRALQPLCPGQASPLRSGHTQGASKLWVPPDGVPPDGDKDPEQAGVGGTEMSWTVQHMELSCSWPCLGKALPFQQALQQGDGEWPWATV